MTLKSFSCDSFHSGVIYGARGAGGGGGGFSPFAEGVTVS